MDRPDYLEMKHGLEGFAWLRRQVLVWLFPDLKIELDVFERAFHSAMVSNRELEAELATIKKPDEARIRRVDGAIARQLQRSIEHKARMVIRLGKLSAKLKLQADPAMIDAADDIDDILKDREPF